MVRLKEAVTLPIKFYGLGGTSNVYFQRASMRGGFKIGFCPFELSIFDE